MARPLLRRPPCRLLAAALALALASSGCGLAPRVVASPPARKVGARVVHAGRLDVALSRLGAGIARSPSLLLSDGALFWLRPDGPRHAVLERVAIAAPSRAPQAIGVLPFALGPALTPKLLASTSSGSVVAAAVPGAGVDSGVVADAWLVRHSADRLLADLAPKGTRPRFAQDGSVAVAGPGVVFLSVGSRAASPVIDAPARDIVFRVGQNGATVQCPAPVDAPASAVWPAAGGGFVVAAGAGLSSLAGCPGAMRETPLVALAPGLYPLLVGTRPGRRHPVVTWVLGLRGTVLGAWRYRGGRLRRLWSVPSSALAVQVVPPDEVLATAATGASTLSLLYQVPTGRSAGPFRDLHVLAAGSDSLVLRQHGDAWLLRTVAK